MKKYVSLITLIPIRINNLSLAASPTYIYPTVNDMTVSPGYQDTLRLLKD